VILFQNCIGQLALLNFPKKNFESHWSALPVVGWFLRQNAIDIFFKKRLLGSRFARWYIFKPNLGKFWRVLQCNVGIHNSWAFGLFYGHLVYFVVILYIFSSFGIFYCHLVCCTKKNLATLLGKLGSCAAFTYFKQ
jgi:hypothetical protein